MESYVGFHPVPRLSGVGRLHFIAWKMKHDMTSGMRAEGRCVVMKIHFFFFFGRKLGEILKTGEIGKSASFLRSWFPHIVYRIMGLNQRIAEVPSSSASSS